MAYGYEDSKDLAAVFQGRAQGYAYGRQSNPTVTALEDKITLLEEGLDTICFATGMSALTTTLLALLRKGDHLISSQFLFGNTNSVFNTLATLGVEVTFVDATRAESISAAVQKNTKAVFVETIANPRTHISDLDKIGVVCEKAGLVYIVDNTMTTPYLFTPKKLKASLVINSLTKSICGHGTTLGGAVTETGVFDWTRFENIYDNYKKKKPAFWGITQIRKKGLRDFGGALAPEAAGRISMGAETLALRMDRCCSNAEKLADFFNESAGITVVHYPGLDTHAQHGIAAKYFRRFGFLMSIELEAGRDVFEFLNRLQLVISSSNLGDNRTLAIPVAHTIFYEMGPERRASMGVTDNMVRLSIGIEEPEDLVQDFKQALD